MTYIKKYLSSPEDLQKEYDRNPELFISFYSKYETFLGPEESKILLDELMENHNKK